MVKKGLFLLIVLVLMLTACSGDPNVAGKGVVAEQARTRDQISQYADSQPIPSFEWSLERAIVIAVYRARNEAAATFSYGINPYNNSIIWECASVGYPIPGGTKLTNPQQIGYKSEYGVVTLPMAEPNGLYMPESSAGTFVSCINPDGTVSPVFSEWYVMTFPYPMQVVDGKWVRVPQVQPSIVIETTR